MEKMKNLIMKQRLFKFRKSSQSKKPKWWCCELGPCKETIMLYIMIKVPRGIKGKRNTQVNEDLILGKCHFYKEYLTFVHKPVSARILRVYKPFR